MNNSLGKHLLVILSHPDDESFPMGGTLAKYTSSGVQVSLICATLGELGIPSLHPAQAALVREKELRAAASELGIHTLHFMRYQDGNLSKINTDQAISQLLHAMRRIHPEAVITFGPDGISGHPDHVAISRLVTTSFDLAVQKSFVSPFSRLYYLAPSEATLQGCGVIPSQDVAGGPVASIDITDYRLPKVRAMQCHASQNPPYKGTPEQEAENLTCHEYFTLARPEGNYANLTDLFTPLQAFYEQKE